jgi:plastocyanin domain-containing protein
MMRSAGYLLPLAALAALSSASCSKASATTNDAPAKTWVSADGTKNYQVSVGEHGFVPGTVTVARGEKAALEFTRTTDHTCATAVVFPELNVKKDLPLNVAVAIPVPTDATRTVGFECGMGMYKSSVVIK